MWEALAVKASAQPKPPASTDSNQGWMWSADRGARNLLGWHQRNGGGRQAGKSRSVRQTDRTRNATWIVQWSWKPILLERMDGSPASADNS